MTPKRVRCAGVPSRSVRSPQSAVRNCDRPLPQRVITKNERGHCFDNRHGPWKNTRIMPSAGGKLSLLVRSGDGFLLERDRCRRLKRNAEVCLLYTSDAADERSSV